MTIQSMIDRGRTLAAVTMIDSGTISRGVGGGTLDPTTGVWTPAAGAVIHSGPCRVKATGAQEQTAIFGDEVVTAQRFVVSFPHDIPDVQIDDTVTVSSSGDSLMASRLFRVVAVETKSVLHSRRLGVEVVA